MAQPRAASRQAAAAPRGACTHRYRAAARHRTQRAAQAQLLRHRCDRTRLGRRVVCHRNTCRYSNQRRAGPRTRATLRDARAGPPFFVRAPLGEPWCVQRLCDATAARRVLFRRNPKRCVSARRRLPRPRAALRRSPPPRAARTLRARLRGPHACLLLRATAVAALGFRV